MHAYGPSEGRTHTCELKICRHIEQQLRDICFINGDKFYVQADRGYNMRNIVVVTFQGVNLTVIQRRMNRSNGSVRVTVEWSCKEVKMYWTVVD